MELKTMMENLKNTLQKNKLQMVFLIGLGVLIVIGMGLYIYNQGQKSKAAGDTVTLSFNPSSQTVTSGQDFTATINAGPSSDMTMRGYHFNVAFDKSKVQVKDIKYLSGNPSAGLADSNSTLSSVNAAGTVKVVGEYSAATGQVIPACTTGTANPFVHQVYAQTPSDVPAATVTSVPNDCMTLPVSDNFSGSSLNQNIWNLRTVNGGSAVESGGGGVNLSVPGSGSNDQEGGIVTKQKLCGNFDLQFNYSNFNSTLAKNSGSLELVIDRGDNTYAHISRYRTAQPDSDQIISNLVLSSKGLTPDKWRLKSLDNNNAGKLRIKRVGTTVYAYFDQGFGWQILNIMQNAFTDPAWIILRAGSWGPDHPAVSGSISNFSVTANSTVDPSDATNMFPTSFTDSFSGSLTDEMRYWNKGLADVQGKLDVSQGTFNPSITKNTKDWDYADLWGYQKVRGDFDISVDVSKFVPVKKNRSDASLFVDVTDYSSGKAKYSTMYVQFEQYTDHKDISTNLEKDDGWQNSKSVNIGPNRNSGKLRLTRVGQTMSAYYDIGKGWVKLASYANGFTYDVNFHVQTNSGKPDKPNVSASFDNFTLTSPSAPPPTAGPSGSPTTTTTGAPPACAGLPIATITFTSLSADPSDITTSSDGAFYKINTDNTLSEIPVVAADLPINGGISPTLGPTVEITNPGGTEPTATGVTTVEPTQPGGTEPTATGVPGAVDMNLNLKLKFQGIISKPADEFNSFLVKVTAEAGDGTTTVSGGTFTADSGGIWSGSVPMQLVPGSDYKIFVKGPMHLQKRICDQTPSETAPGTYHCDNGAIILKAGDDNLDFSGVYQLVGDLPQQDGVVNAYDISLVTNNFGKTDKDTLKLADLNLDGVIDTQDYSLIIAALSVRSDEGP